MSSPLAKGKGRLVESTKSWTVPSEPLTEKVGDGYLMRLDLSDLIQRNIYFFGYYEPQFATVLKSVLRPGDTFVDVGANIGQFSLIAAMRVGEHGRVIAIEPEINNANQLRTNLDLNQIRNSAVHQLAVGRQSGEVEFFTRGQEQGFTNRGVHSLHQHEDWSNPQKIIVKLDLLDNVLKSETRVDVIKMDVEGGELDALKGAVDSLARFDPIIFLEANEVCTHYFGHSTSDVKQWLADRGLSIRRLKEGQLEPVTSGAEVDAMLVAYSRKREDSLRLHFLE